MKFNDLELALGMAFEILHQCRKMIKIKIQKFWGLFPKFAEVTEEKLVSGRRVYKNSLQKLLLILFECQLKRYRKKCT